MNWIILQTLRGSSSSVSKPIFATKYSLESIFRDLQDLQSFAPLRSQIFDKKSSNVFVFLFKFLQKIAIFQPFPSNFASILMKISRNFAEYSRICWEFFKFQKFSREFWEIFWNLTEFWQNSDPWKVRLVRSVADRTFQPRYEYNDDVLLEEEEYYEGYDEEYGYEEEEEEYDE